MKTHMVKQLRIFLIVITTVVLIITIAYLIYSIKTPKIITEKITLYNARSSTNLSYQVKLIPNPIYDVKYLDSGQTYITTFTDSIDITYDYNFAGNKTSQINGDYKIELKLEGYTGKDKEFKSLWIKNYPTIKTGKFQINAEEHNVTEKISIALSNYLDFVKKLEEESKISSSKHVKITCTTNVESIVDEGSINEQYINTMVIPLTSDFYDISGQLEDKKESPIEKTEEKVIPIKIEKIIFLCVIIILLALLLCYCIFFIIPYETSSKEKEINTILKKHGSRIVSIETEVDLIDKTTISLHSFNGLVTISDELVKPILYTHRELKEDITNFYVICDREIYKYSLNDVEEIIYEPTTNIS